MLPIRNAVDIEVHVVCLLLLVCYQVIFVQQKGTIVVPVFVSAAEMHK